MKTKVLVGIGLTGLLATGVYAAYNNQGMKQGANCNMQGAKKMMMQKGYKKGQRGPMALLKKLNLTPEQTKQIQSIRKDMMKDRVTPDVAFTKDSFDKVKFIEIMKQKRENMIESKAEMIDRVYKVLTPKQKEQFKVLIELKKEKRMAMIDKRMNF